MSECLRAAIGCATAMFVRRSGLAALLAVFPAAVCASPSAELTRLVDSPTAGILPKGRYEFGLRFFADGGASCHLDAGALERLTVGITYGGERILGNQAIDWYPRLEAEIHYRLAEESQAFPAVVVGYESQGYGPHDNGRYASKAKGVFVSFSKNYLSPLGQFGVHGGVNLTSDNDDGDDDLSGWVGMDKTLNEDILLVGEYNLGRDSDGHSGSGLGHPLLHAGVQVNVAPQLTISLFLKDLLTQEHHAQITRELSVRYTEEL